MWKVQKTATYLQMNIYTCVYVLKYRSQSRKISQHNKILQNERRNLDNVEIKQLLFLYFSETTSLQVNFYSYILLRII